MSGNATVMYLRFISRTTMKYISGVPAPSVLAYTTDLRQFSGNFETEFDLALNESFNVSSHDFAEVAFNLPDGTPFTVGVVYLEHTTSETGASSFKLNANGRDLIGQLIEIPYKKNFYYKGGIYHTFVTSSAIGTYISKYSTFKNQSLINNEGAGAFPGQILYDTVTSRKIGPTLQEYADTILNLIYQNAQGQIEIYGREVDGSGNVILPPVIGTLIKSHGFTNVERLIKSSDYSKVISDYTIFYTDAQNKVDSTKIPAYLNPDPRARGVWQPQYQVFASTDLILFAGGISVDQRRAQQAASFMRKSNQNLNSVTIITDTPWFTDPKTGVITPFEKYQIYHVTSPDDKLDIDMVIAGIHYSQQPGSLEVQLLLVEPDTLI